MPAGGSLWDTIRGGIPSEEEAAFTLLFPGKNRFEHLQMLGETQPKAVTPFAVLDVFRKRYKSKVLTQFTESHNIIKIGQERKGRLEASEVAVGIRRAKREDED